MDDRHFRRLARYFAGECPAEEALETQRWLAADPARQLEADRLHDLWRASAESERVANSDDAWERLAARMQVTEGVPQVTLFQTGETSVHRKRFRWQRDESSRSRIAVVAAAAAVLVASATLYARHEGLIGSGGDRVTTIAGAQPRVFRTARGQRAVIMLGDGTRVELGAESVLRVKPFGAGARELTLDGQAVFDVAHDTLHPFLVRSGNAITEDLGTRFTVRAYHGDSQVEVLVSSGQVALRAVGAPASSGTLLGPADLGILDSIGRTTVRNGADSTRYLAWTRDRLVFENAPLGEVVREVSRWFDVSIDVDDRVSLSRRVTLNVPARALPEVLGAITVPLRLHFSMRGRDVSIH
ncbi:MAG: FecR protein [Gemmatimonadetes bacterium]|nr:FecR protein [Gemmatimonadota bacterium]